MLRASCPTSSNGARLFLKMLFSLVWLFLTRSTALSVAVVGNGGSRSGVRIVGMPEAADGPGVAADGPGVAVWINGV